MDAILSAMIASSTAWLTDNLLGIALFILGTVLTVFGLTMGKKALFFAIKWIKRTFTGR